MDPNHFSKEDHREDIDYAPRKRRELGFKKSHHAFLTRHFEFNRAAFSAKSRLSPNFNKARVSIKLMTKRAAHITTPNHFIDPTKSTSEISTAQMMNLTSVGPNNPESMVYLSVILYRT